MNVFFTHTASRVNHLIGSSSRSCSNSLTFSCMSMLWGPKPESPSVLCAIWVLACLKQHTGFRLLLNEGPRTDNSLKGTMYSVSLHATYVEKQIQQATSFSHLFLAAASKQGSTESAQLWVNLTARWKRTSIIYH